jgi:hypothetical protein
MIREAYDLRPNPVSKRKTNLYMRYRFRTRVCPCCKGITVVFMTVRLSLREPFLTLFSGELKADTIRSVPSLV